MKKEYFPVELGTGKDLAWNSIELQQIDNLNKEVNGGSPQIKIQEVSAGMWWLPLATELLSPIVKKVIGSGQCTEKQMQSKLLKEMRAAGFFGDLAKSLAKTLASKAVQGIATAVSNKAADVAQQGTSNLLDAVGQKIQGKGRKCKGGRTGPQIGGCDPLIMPCPDADKSSKVCTKKGAASSAGAKTACAKRAETKRDRRNVAVKKIMKEKGLSLIEASKYVKANNIEY